MVRCVAVTALLGLTVVALAQAPAVPTLKVKTQLVVIDVVVTDKQGRPVKNLRASDFALAENGAPQKIEHFEAHAGLSAEEAVKLPPMPKLEPNIFTNYSPSPPGDALNVLLLDELNSHDKFNSKSLDQAGVRQQMLRYLATPHPGVRMAIFRLNEDLKLLQGFTSDPEVLRSALTSWKNAPRASRLIDNPVCDAENAELAAIPDPSGGLASGMAECRASEQKDRSLSTLQAMSALARYMGTLRGRKNLLWFSTSFPIPHDPYEKELSDQLRETMALFAKSQVAVYPIASGGLMAGPPNRPRSFLNRIDNDYATMAMVAEDTGGKVFANTNDLAGAVEQAIDDGSNFYTLSYSPTDRDRKGDFRKVEVKLAQAGYTLAYRHGYYAEDIDKPVRGAEVTAGSSPTDTASSSSNAALRAAMEYGSPQPVDIVFKAAVNPATGSFEDVVARANSLSPKTQGPFERYVVQVAALPTVFTYTRTATARVHMAAQLVTCVYSADGKLINMTAIKVDGDLDDAHYRSIMANGLKFRQEVSVPVKGESFLRIGVEDLATGRMGAVEIPVATVAKLKPLVSVVSATGK